MLPQVLQPSSTSSPVQALNFVSAKVFVNGELYCPMQIAVKCVKCGWYCGAAGYCEVLRGAREEVPQGIGWYCEVLRGIARGEGRGEEQPSRLQHCLSTAALLPSAAVPQYTFFHPGNAMQLKLGQCKIMHC